MVVFKKSLVGMLLATATLSFSACADFFHFVGMDEVGYSLEEMEATENLEFSPPEDYLLGQVVSESVLEYVQLYNSGQRGPIGSTPIEQYLTKIGRTLAMASDRPETFTGYRFILMDSDEINAFAVPGGFVLISAGIFQICENEDEIAGVLAHEVNHVVEAHPTKSLAAGLRMQAASKVTATVAESLFEDDGFFSTAIEDIFNKSFDGYGRRLELEADVYAVRTLIRAGYDPTALADVLNRLTVGGGSHGNPGDRANDVLSTVDIYKSMGIGIPERNSARDERFREIVEPFKAERKAAREAAEAAAESEQDAE